MHSLTRFRVNLPSTTGRRRGNFSFVGNPLRTFRGYTPPPNPAAWKASHGVEPYQLSDVAAKYVSRAAAAVFRDDSTLNAAEAIDAKSQLDRVLERVHAEAGLPEEAVVLFRAEDRTFWVYSR